MNDIQILIKALTRRGLCYNTAEKYKLAADDLARVRDLDPMNKQAADGLRNALKYIKQDTGEDYMPKQDETPLAELKSKSKPAEPVKPQEVKKPAEEPKKTTVPEAPKKEEAPAKKVEK